MADVSLFAFVEHHALCHLIKQTDAFHGAVFVNFFLLDGMEAFGAFRLLAQPHLQRFVLF